MHLTVIRWLKELTLAERIGYPLREGGQSFLKP